MGIYDSKTSANVTAAFRTIRDRLVGKFGKDAGLAIMGEMFAVILTDNGTEFSNPLAIEFDCEGNHIANLFNIRRIPANDIGRRTGKATECESPMDADQVWAFTRSERQTKALAAIPHCLNTRPP